MPTEPYDWKHLWKAPENTRAYFSPHYDDALRHEHPFLYALAVVGILLSIIVPIALAVLLAVYTLPCLSDSSSVQNFAYMALGVYLYFLGPIGIGLGLCNLLMIPYRQYLGHRLTILSCGIGLGATILGYLLLLYC